MKIISTNIGHNFDSRPLTLRSADAAVGAVAVLTDRRDQEMLGFGAALTEAACVMLNRLEHADRDRLLHEIFSPEETNLSIARICVGSSDYACVPYHYAPVSDDLNMEHFDASYDLKNCIPIIRQALRCNPDLFLFSSPWSPPAWMKTSGSLYGGWMRDRYISAYALYYLKFLQFYKEQGITISAVTPQNESETDQSGRMPACLWHPETEMKFVRELRSLLDKNGFENLKIWITDHNYVYWHRINYELSDEETKKAVAGAAWHPYEGHPEMVSWVREQHPDMENHWTEGGLIPPAGIDYSRMGYGYAAQSFIMAINNGIQSITTWNLALDEFGSPNIGPFDCRGAIEISRDGKHIKRSMEYNILSHFSRYVKRGARRIVVEKTALPSHFDIAAFENPDGQIVAVISNSEKFDSSMTLKIGNNVVDLWIFSDSINTILL